MNSDSQEKDDRLERRRDKWQRAYLVAVFLLVGGLCFSAGLLTNLWQKESPIEISIVPPSEASPSPSGPAVLGESVVSEAGGKEPGETAKKEACAFVGSKNSTKYHLPSCSYAKRILPKNIVCFSSREDAEKRGYAAGCLK